jgi:23S rRNA pseudouridine1911/1915/1917 synthase
LLPQHSRSRLKGWIEAGLVLVNAVAHRTSAKLRGGEAIAVTEAADSRVTSFAPEAIPLAIAFEDEAILVLDKPAGLVVHPGSGNWDGTLLNALLHHAPALAVLPRAGIVHRLDKDTSGLLVAAKNERAMRSLAKQFAAHAVERAYNACMEPRATIVDAPIGRHPDTAHVDGSSRHRQAARTHVEVIARFGPRRSSV